MCSESPRDAAHSTDASECSPETEMKLPTINATPSSLLRSTLSRLQDSLPSTSVRQPGVLLRTPNDKQTQQNSIWEECLAAGIEGCRRFDRGGPRPNPASPAGLSSGLQRQPPGPVRTRQLRRRGASGRKGARCCLACRSSAPALSGRPQPPALGMPAVGSNWDSTQPVLCGRALYRIHQTRPQVHVRRARRCAQQAGHRPQGRQNGRRRSCRRLPHRRPRRRRRCL